MYSHADLFQFARREMRKRVTAAKQVGHRLRFQGFTDYRASKIARNAATKPEQLERLSVELDKREIRANRGAA